MRRLMQPLWILLALVFLAEAWLWEHLKPMVARVVACLPLRDVKSWTTRRIAHLSPPTTLLVFLAPVIFLFPLKLVGVWLIAHHHWLSALSVIMLGKLLGVGIAAFIFEITRPKLMLMKWFRQVYGVVMRVRGWARTMSAPVMARLRHLRAELRFGPTPMWLRVMLRTRRRILTAR